MAHFEVPNQQSKTKLARLHKLENCHENAKKSKYYKNNSIIFQKRITLADRINTLKAYMQQTARILEVLLI